MRQRSEVTLRVNAVALSNTTDAQRELNLYKNAERLLKL